MSAAFNTYPANPEQSPATPLPERVQWRDGGTEGDLYRTPGEVLQISYASADETHPSLPAARELHYAARGVGVLRTESGSRYILGLGTVVREGTDGSRKVADLPVELPPMTVGKPWEIPGFSDTSPVKSFLLRGSTEGRTENKGIVSANKDNPFPRLQQELVQAGRFLAAHSRRR